jgi:hypothetical protein
MRSKNIGVLPLESTPKINSNHVYQALSALIEVSRLGQVRARRDYPSHNIGDWIRNWCTVRIGASRGSGHTRSMARTIIENGWNVIVFVPTRTDIRAVRDTCLDYANKIGASCERSHDLLASENFQIRFETCRDRVHMNRTLGVDAIFIDSASSDRNLDEIAWETACGNAQPNRDFHLIYLQ